MSSTQEFTCPCCAGAIEFDISSQKMKCPFCGTEFDIETLKGYDECLKQDGQDEMEWQIPSAQWTEDEASGMRTYICNSCGGEIIGDATSAATDCPYCGNHVVMANQFSGSLRPDYVIPFKLDKEAAKEALKKHLCGKRLLPKVFKSENHIDEIKGIYVPFWLFQADADAHIRYKASRVRRWSDSNYNYTETSFYTLERGGNIAFDNIPVDGSSKMADDLMESIEPYDATQAVDFSTAYLAGYLADKYDVTAQESIGRANKRVKSSTEDAFKRTTNGYTTVTPESTTIRLSNGKAKYALYPVWLLNTSWRGKKYTFAMNGQTGKLVGDLPLDKSAYWKWLVALSSAFGVISSAVMLLLYYLL